MAISSVRVNISVTLTLQAGHTACSRLAAMSSLCFMKSLRILKIAARKVAATMKSAQAIISPERDNDRDNRFAAKRCVVSGADDKIGVSQSSAERCFHKRKPRLRFIALLSRNRVIRFQLLGVLPVDAKFWAMTRRLFVFVVKCGKFKHDIAWNARGQLLSPSDWAWSISR